MKQEALELWSIVICSAGFTGLAHYFCKRYLACAKRAAVLFDIAVFFNYLIGNLICQRGFYLAGAALTQLVFAGAVVLLFQAEWEKKILAAAVYLFLTRLTRKAVGSVCSILALIFLRLIGQEPLIVPGSGAELGIIFLEFAAATAAVCLLAQPLRSVFELKIKSWYRSLSFPLIVLIVLEDILEWGATRGILFRGEENRSLYQNQLFSLGTDAALVFLCICSGIFFVFGMERIYREQKKKEQYQGQVGAYQMLEEQYVRMERLRHDMKNHVISLQRLLQSREWEKMERYLQKMTETGALDETEENTGNQVVDALLYQKRQRAEEAGISWKCQMQLGKQLEVEDFDFCVMLGNILDNAIEACEKSEGERWIEVQSGIVKDFFLMEVKNSTDAKEIPGVLKVVLEERGIGLYNVKETVKKYNGAVNMEILDRTFAISVLLPALRRI